MRICRPTGLALLVTILALVLLAQPAISSSQGTDVKGLFGTVSALSVDAAGETLITLDTKGGTTELTASADTQVSIPGLESATAGGLMVGDSVAVLASAGRATRILVQTDRPVKNRHLTGVLTSVDETEETITLVNRQGQSISVALLEDYPGLRLGEVVTAVVEQDLATGSLIVTGLERAAANLDRITAALDHAEGSNSQSTVRALRQRLIGNSAGHLSSLAEASQKGDRSLRERVRQELANVQEEYGMALTKFGGGEPRAEISGIIVDISGSGQQGSITVASPGMESVNISVTSDTKLLLAPLGFPNQAAEVWLRGDLGVRAFTNRFGGRETSIALLDLASRVRVWYGVDTFTATRILVLPAASLAASKADLFLALSQRGEAIGKVGAIDTDTRPPEITIEDEITSNTLTLTIPPDSDVLDSVIPTSLASLVGSTIRATYDPTTLAITELSILEVGASTMHLHGVVHSFIPKRLPRNFSILTNDGIRALNHTPETVIVRDGRRVTISQVRVGDLVRGNTRYTTEVVEGDLVLLNLKSPKSAPIQGTIRGISVLEDGDATVTISNNRFELVSVEVRSETRLFMRGSVIGLDGLAVGQRVSGVFDPVSSEAVQLRVEAPKTQRVRGEITAIDESGSAITITPRRSEPLQLFFMESIPVRIRLRNNSDAQFADLREGQRVLVGFYDPGTMAVLRLIIN